MSEVQTGMTAVDDDIDFEDLMRAEEERLHAELAERMRREEEQKQRALDSARKATSKAHDELNRLRRQYLEDKKRLPDLVFWFDELPEMPVGGDVMEWMDHAAKTVYLVKRWREDFDLAAAVAEETLKRRIRTEKAWQDNTRLLSVMAAALDQLETLKALLPGVCRMVETPPSVLISDTPWEEIESANRNLDAFNERIGAEIKRLMSIGLNDSLLNAHILAVTVPYDMVMGADRATAFRQSVETEAVRRFEQNLAGHLAAVCLTEADLPMDFALYLSRIRTGIATDGKTDVFGRIVRTAEQKKQRENARAMLDKAPTYLPPGLALEWEDLVTVLHKIASGHGELTPTVERRYRDIREQAKQSLKQAYVFAQARAAIAECGLIVEDDAVDMVFDDGEDLPKTMALSVPGYDDRKVLFSLDRSGQTAILPLRFNDRETEYERVLDREFSERVCEGLDRALSRLEPAGITMNLTTEETAAPVLLASELGVTLRHEREGKAPAKHKTQGGII